MARPDPTQRAPTDAIPQWPREWPALHIEGFTAIPWEGDSLLVTVRGQWRGSPPANEDVPVLILDDGRRTHRFAAVPEPSEAAGPPPRFRAVFSIPEELRAAVAAPMTLDLGRASVVLIAGRRRAAPAAADAGTVVDPLVLAERRARRAELSETAHVQRAAAAERASDGLRAELTEVDNRLRAARDRSRGLEAELAARTRALREATQSAHAERQLREELVNEERARRQAAENDAATVHERLRQAEARARELARDVEALRRVEVETQQTAAAATAARRRAEQELQAREQRMGAAEAALATGIDAVHTAEGELRTLRDDRLRMKQELEEFGARAHQLEEHLQRERGERSLAGKQLADARDHATRLGAELARTRTTASAQEQELALATGLVTDLVSAGEVLLTRLVEERERFEQGADGYEHRVAELLSELEETAQARDGAERKLAHALYELSQARDADGHAAVAPPLAEPPPARAEPWLPAALERQVAEDAAAGAELLVAMLPAQALAPGAPRVDYDLELTELGSYRVALADGAGTVAAQNQRRARGADFRVEVDAAGLLALLVAGGARQRGRHRSVRVRGTLRRRRVLRRLPPVRMAPAELARAGIWLDPDLLYRALAHLVEPEWTRPHDFWIAHEISGPGEATCYLHVGGADGLAVAAQPPPGGPVARIRTSRAHFQHVLGGEDPPAPGRAAIAGDAGAVDVFTALVRRAQGLAEPAPRQLG